MSEQQYTIDDLLYLMSRLRDPETGCPWDIKQTFKTIVPYTLEEAYEVADAIEQENYAHLKEELGDLLFQVIFYSQMGNEEGHFQFNDIVHTLVSKLVRRHPHVFPNAQLRESNQISAESADTVLQQWEDIKRAEREEKSEQSTHSILDDIPSALPALNRAEKLQKRAASVGFDWPEAAQVLDKIEEEIHELREAISSGDRAHMEDEMGDLMFACVNLARHLKVKSEMALRSTNKKFDKRFRYLETEISQSGRRLEDTSLEEMDALWEQAKSET